jgi:hypothetical protein
MNKKTVKIFKLIAFLTALAGIVMIFIVLRIDYPQTSLFMSIVYYFNYFTNWTNILLTAYFFITCFLYDYKIGVWSNKDYVRSALLLYILVIGVGFHFLISKFWEPEGILLWGSNICHYITPILMLIDCALLKPSIKIKFKHTVLWLIYPIAYALFVIIKGSLTGHYPYFFLHVGDLGIVRVLINIIGFLCVYLILGNLIAFVNNLRLKLFK